MSRIAITASFLVLAHCLCSSIGQAQVIPLKNSEMEFDGATIHAAQMVPPDWQVPKELQSGVRAWNSPGSSAVALGANASLSQVVEIPQLDEKLTAQNDWRFVLAIDVTGKFSKTSEPAEIWASISDAAAGKTLSQKTFQIEHEAPVSSVIKTVASASSFKAPGAPPEKAFDGDRSTNWHSDYGSKTPKHPHHISIDFGETKTLRGLRYAPRQDGGNGTVKKFEIRITTDGQKWERVFRGEFSYKSRGEVQTVVLDQPVKCRAVRLQCISAIRGERFASCSELVPDIEGGFAGLTDEIDVEERASVQRLFLPLDFANSKNLKRVKVSFGVEPNRYVVVDRVHTFLAPQFATSKMRGKANGKLGPDLLGAGSYGFKGLMIHRLPVLPIMEIFDGSPAAQAGLEKTDLIVGINDRFLPAGNLAPGFEWFENSHESLLGRAAMEAFSSPETEGKVRLNVLRGEELVGVDLSLKFPHEIGNDDFLTNPTTVELINKDLIDHAVATQLENGSWKNNPVHTCLGGLALLSTKDQRHAPRIKSAANWLMSRNAEPGAGFYWHPAFSGIFLCEYYLASGDERAIPVIERMLRMMSSAYHTSKWGTDTFGHGPKALPYGNKSLVAVMVHVMVFEVLAKRCGVKSEIYERLTPFLESAWSEPAEGGHGALGYNASYKDLAEFWSRSGIFMLSLHMRGVRPDMQTAMSKIMYERHPWFRNSHAYGEPGGLLGLIGLSQINPAYFDETLSRYRWWFALAWEPGKGLHFTIPHMGAPYMEGPILINNGYAVVTNAHKKTLHITGSKQTNWLDVSDIPVPISDVMVLQDTQGEVSLRCKIPGPTIYFTTDGSPPSKESTRYEKPFSVEPGGVVKAIAINESGASKIAERGFGLKKSDWSIVSATGNEDQQKAINQAGFAIDGDNFIGWVPDAGEGAKGYPHELIIDLGEEQKIELAGVRYISEPISAARISVEASQSKNSGFDKIGSSANSKFSKDVRITLSPESKVRYLKFVFDSPFGKSNNQVLMVGEIDIR